MNEDRRDQLRNLTLERSRDDGLPSASAEPGAPAAGDLFVLAETADFPVEWLLLDRSPDDPGRWLAVPADTNPLRGPGDLWIGPDREGGPLAIRCRFGVELPGSALRARRRTGRVAAEDIARALGTVRDHRRGALEAGPLADEVAADPEYQDWERSVLRPAHETVATLVAHEPVPEPARSEARLWLPIAAALTLLCLGLGTWNLVLRQQVEELSTPVLIGSSQEIVVGSDVRAPAPLRVRQGDQRLLVFLVLSGEAAGYERYRVELTDDEGTALWTSPDVERGPLPELSLVIPSRFLDSSKAPTHLVVLGLEEDRALPLSEVPIDIERGEDSP